MEAQRRSTLRLTEPWGYLNERLWREAPHQCPIDAAPREDTLAGTSHIRSDQTIGECAIERRWIMVQLPDNLELEHLKPVWISGSSLEKALELKAMLGNNAQVYVGQEPPRNEKAPSYVIFCPSGESFASEIRWLRAAVPNTSILALGSRLNLRFARTTLLAGGHGFIHLGMQPAQVFRALAAAQEDKTLVPRELLADFLDEMLSQEDVTVLYPRQREFLELIMASWPIQDEIVV